MNARSKFLGAAALAAALCLPACSEKTAQGKEGATKVADASSAVRKGIFELACGCSDAVTTTSLCGNYVKLDGDFMPLGGVKLDEAANPGFNPDMIACHKEHVRAKLEGKVTNGVFVATSLQLVDAAAGDGK
ncbi:MAG: hypothetical protein R3F30_10845 [Planctomycetota bacterium]